MGWETSLVCSVVYNRCTYDSLYKVESDLEEIDNKISNLKNRLHSLAVMTEPKKFIADEECDPLFWISEEIRDCLESLEEAYIDKYKLELLKDNWDNCHTRGGDPIHPPKDFKWNTAFIDGDFIMTKEEAAKFKNELGHESSNC